MPSLLFVVNIIIHSMNKNKQLPCSFELCNDLFVVFDSPSSNRFDMLFEIFEIAWVLGTLGDVVLLGEFDLLCVCSEGSFGGVDSTNVRVNVLLLCIPFFVGVPFVVVGGVELVGISLPIFCMDKSSFWGVLLLGPNERLIESLLKLFESVFLFFFNGAASLLRDMSVMAIFLFLTFFSEGSFFWHSLLL